MSPPNAHATARPCHGLSLVELTCALAVTATLLGSAVPSLTDFARRQRLLATASELQADIGLARTSAIQRGAPVRLSWQALPDGGACWMVHTGAADDCSCSTQAHASCRGDATVLRTAGLPPREAIRLDAASRSLLFDPRRGTVSPTATLRLDDRHAHALHLVVNIMGRVRVCSPEGRWAGYKGC